MTKLNKPVARISDVQLDGSFGPDRNRRIVVTIHPNGTLELRPERTRRSETIHLLDAYRFALRCRVNRITLEKARTKKAKRAERLARARQERAEKRLTLRPCD
jgi:hypothetical protein